jgi:hypothetical protein
LRTPKDPFTKCCFFTFFDDFFTYIHLGKKRRIFREFIIFIIKDTTNFLRTPEGASEESYNYPLFQGSQNITFQRV